MRYLKSFGSIGRKKYAKFILPALIVGAVAVVSFIKIDQPTVENLGATKPAGLFTYRISGSGISSSATSFTLNSLTLPQNDYPVQDSDVSDTFYLTIEPGSTDRQEFVSCTTIGANTGSTVTISGCTRGLAPITPYTASSTLQFAHSGGAAVIFSDPPQLWNQAALKEETNHFTGINTISTTTDDIVRFYFANSPTSTLDTYFWKNRLTGAFGFATSSSGELAWNATGGTSFTPVRPLVITSGEMKLSTSTYDFAFDADNNLRIATTTITSGTASGKRLDDYFNNRWNATTTHPALTISKATTTSLFVGTGNPAGTWTFYVGGNATSTLSFASPEFCSSTAPYHCTTTLNRVATSSAVANTKTGALSTIKTLTFASGEATEGQVWRITSSLRKTVGTNAGFDFYINVMGAPLFRTPVSNGCRTSDTAVEIAAVGWIEIVFGSGNTATIYGSCVANDVAATVDDQVSGSIATTTLKFSSESWYIDFRGVSNASDTISMDGFSVIKMGR